MYTSSSIQGRYRCHFPYYCCTWWYKGCQPNCHRWQTNSCRSDGCSLKFFPNCEDVKEILRPLLILVCSSIQLTKRAFPQENYLRNLLCFLGYALKINTIIKHQKNKKNYTFSPDVYQQ